MKHIPEITSCISCIYFLIKPYTSLPVIQRIFHQENQLLQLIIYAYNNTRYSPSKKKKKKIERNFRILPFHPFPQFDIPSFDKLLDKHWISIGKKHFLVENISRIPSKIENDIKIVRRNPRSKL